MAETWVDNILRQAATNPGPQLPRQGLGEFLTGLSSVQYKATIYAAVAGCQFQTSAEGIARFAPQGFFMHQGKECLWLFDSDDRWLALPVDTIGRVDADVWYFEAGHVKVELMRGGEVDARSEPV